MKNPDKGPDRSPNEPLSKRHVELDPKVQVALGEALQAHYDDLVKSPIPDRFLVLLAELEAKERREDT